MGQLEYKIGDLFFNYYKIVDVLRGGCGIVYICRSEEGRIYAFKSFQDKFFYKGDEIADRAVTDFYREAEVWLKLGMHPNIVSAFVVYDIDEKPHVHMEYVDGGSLRGKIKQGGLSLQVFLVYVLQFCRGINYANSVDLGGGKRGVVHRDIKPENIMLTKDGTLKITDFGLVKALGASTTETPWGTPEYMSPEQFRTMDVDTRADIYSFGVVLYEMLSGGLPFSPYYTGTEKQEASQEEEIFRLIESLDFHPGTAKRLVSSGYSSLRTIALATPSKIVALTGLAEEEAKRIIQSARWLFYDHQHQRVLPKPLKQLNQDIPEGLDKVVLKCLEKKPWDRYQSFQGLEEDLRKFCHDHLGITLILPEPMILEKEKIYADVLFTKGYSFFTLQKFREALQCFEKLLELNPHLGHIWTWKGQTLLKLGMFREALECFDHALKIGKETHRSHNLAMKGWALANLERFGEALQYLDKALELNQKEPSAWCNKGIVLGMLGRFGEAIKYFDKAIELDPKDTDAWLNRGLAFYSMDHFEESQKCFDKVIEINPRDADAWFNKGSVHGSLGMYGNAIKCYDRALELKPDYAAVWLNRGLALIKLFEKTGDRNMLREALKCVSKALEIDPGFKDAQRFKDYIERLIKY